MTIHLRDARQVRYGGMKDALMLLGGIGILVTLVFLMGHFKEQEVKQVRDKPPPAGMAQIEVQTEIVVEVPDLKARLDSHFFGSPFLDVPPGMHTVKAEYNQAS